jgi:putative SOS response-associated peptidase YedK
MCARFLTPSQAAAERYWELRRHTWRFGPSWRVLPTQDVPIVLSVDGEVTGRMMRWGLIPHSGEAKYPLINATVEKLETGYPWGGPWKRQQRCIFVMAGFYEPHVFEGGRKEPFYVHLADREIFGVAGIWERRKAEDGAESMSAALIAVPANELMAEIHNEKKRMPAVLLEAHHAAWLRGSPEEARAALVEYPSADMVAWQVSRRLYANKTPDDESLIERVQGSE